AELQLRPKYKPAISGQEQALALLQKDENQKGLAAATAVKSPASTSAPSTPQPKRTEPAARPQQPRAVVVQTPPPPPPSPAPSPAPQRLVAAAEHVELAPSTIADAEQYLLAAAADFDFTRALPKVTPPSDIATLKRELTLAAELKKPNADRLNELGTEALLVGRVDLARTAFGVAAKVNPSDWRSPYLAGLAAQIAGDGAAARLSYRESLTRNPRPEAYTSLAILDLADDHLDAAFVQANQAVKLDGGYEPGRFTAGMLALALQNVHAADENLTKAIALGQAPERTAFFLGAVKGAKPQASADITR
ncbi:MAG: hypothetical protein ACREM8_04315, partial [Vulcanimicrobiaceae bacterium]